MRDPVGATAWGRRLVLVVPAAAMVAAWTPLARGQEVQRRMERALRLTDPTARLRVESDLSLTERAEIEVGGFASFTGLNLNDESGNSRGLLQYEATLYGRASLGGAHTLFGRARFRYQDFTPGDSFNGEGDQWVEPFLDRYWYEFDYRRAVLVGGGERPEGDLNVRVGRQFVDWGAGLALSENLYAVQTTLAFNDRVSVEGLAGVTPGDESVIDFDASRAEFDRNTKRGFFGGLLRYTTTGGDSFYAYGLHMPDYNTDTASRTPDVGPVDFHYSATYVGVGATGSFTPSLVYLGEFVYEFGRDMSDPLFGFQQKQNISAFAARAQLTWLLRDANLSKLEFESLLASGDSDRLVSTDTVGGNAPGTDDNGYNSLGFANTGLAFAPSLSNLWTVRVGASTFPLRSVPAARDLQIGADVFLFNKLDANAPIDEPTKDQMYLGFETDVFLNYRVTSDFAVNARYGVFLPGSAITADNTRHFVLVGCTLSF